jgi:hypothetical protein
MAYLLDANVLITAKRLHYGFDFCPGFWEALLQANQAGRLFCVEKVVDELIASGDELSSWIKFYRQNLSLAVDQRALPSFSAVSNWVTTQGYTPDAQAQFLQVADYYLTAQALAGGHTVVTLEVPSGSKRRIKIPDVCVGLGIKCISTYEMLRAEQVKLVLA